MAVIASNYPPIARVLIVAPLGKSENCVSGKLGGFGEEFRALSRVPAGRRNSETSFKLIAY